MRSLPGMGKEIPAWSLHTEEAKQEAEEFWCETEIEIVWKFLSSGFGIGLNTFLVERNKEQKQDPEGKLGAFVVVVVVLIRHGLRWQRRHLGGRKGKQATCPISLSHTHSSVRQEEDVQAISHLIWILKLMRPSSFFSFFRPLSEGVSIFVVLGPMTWIDHFAFPFSSFISASCSDTFEAQD